MSPSTAEWLLEISGLTVGTHGDAPQDIVGQGMALAAQLRRAATGHVMADGCLTGPSSTCRLRELDGGEAACRLAREVATADDSSLATDPDRSAHLFMQAVRAAATAVFHCRRHAHPAGDCWFSGNATDGCASVLAVAHRVIA
ncbi:hypothetical protein [Euzebya tangerina]|uniref:hypothetical protein n=1 Tax=Euzebya tangerina TaxID=591198 RepID=UPI0013C34959|nr:hypothetical protein [Euzebya tangerina]